METSTAEELLQPEQPRQPESSAEPPRLSRLECLGGVIVSPLKTFEHLAEKPQWFLPLAVILLFVLVNDVLSMIMMYVFILPSMFESAGSASYGVVSIFFVSAIGLGMSVAGFAIVFFAMAATLYAIIRAFEVKPEFYPLACALALAEFLPRLIGSVLSEVIPQLTGEGHIYSPDLPTGIAPIFYEFDVPIIAQALIDRIEVFHLWSFGLVAIAIRFVAKVSGERAMLIALIYWAVCILAVAGTGYAGELFAALMGF